jgi:spermidine synthase
MRIRKPQEDRARLRAAHAGQPAVAAHRGAGPGPGGAAGPGRGGHHALHAQQLRMPTTVVEINPQVIAACRSWFHLPATARGGAATTPPTGWPGRAGQRAAAARGPLRPRGRRAGAGRRGFYAACRAVLAAGRRDERQPVRPRRQLRAQLARIAAAFGADQVWSLRPTREGNTVVVAGRGVVVPRATSCAARRYHRAALRLPGPAGAQVAAHGAALNPPADPPCRSPHEPPPCRLAPPAAAAPAAHPGPRAAGLAPAAALAARRRLITRRRRRARGARFGAGAAACMPLVRLGGAGLRAPGRGKPLDTEALTEWLAGAPGCPTCASTR